MDARLTQIVAHPRLQAAAALLERARGRYWPIARLWLELLAIPLAVIGMALLVREHTFGFDAYAYWREPVSGGLYAGAETADGFGVYRYSPAFAQLMSPLWFLPFDAFALVIAAINVALFLWLGGRNWLLWLWFQPIALEIWHGNIHLALAAAAVLGARYPALWALPLLTKVSPGVGLLWFVVRREWRNLLIAVGSTAAVIGLSLLLGGLEVWREWVGTLLSTEPSSAPNRIALPLLLRAPAAVILVVVGARRNWLWVLPVAGMLALPTLWVHGFSMLVGIAAARRLSAPS